VLQEIVGRPQRGPREQVPARAPANAAAAAGATRACGGPVIVRGIGGRKLSPGIPSSASGRQPPWRGTRTCEEKQMERSKEEIERGGERGRLGNGKVLTAET